MVEGRRNIIYSKTMAALPVPPLLYPVGIPYEEYARKNVLALHQAGWGAQAISDFFRGRPSVSTVYSWLRRHEETGHCAPAAHQWPQPDSVAWRGLRALGRQELHAHTFGPKLRVLPGDRDGGPRQPLDRQPRARSSTWHVAENLNQPERPTG